MPDKYIVGQIYEDRGTKIYHYKILQLYGNNTCIVEFSPCSNPQWGNKKNIVNLSHENFEEDLHLIFTPPVHETKSIPRLKLIQDADS